MMTNRPLELYFSDLDLTPQARRFSSEKSTRTEDPAAALVIAEELEATARAERARVGRVGQPQRLRNRQSPGNTGAGLTQREVDELLGMTERGVRAAEKRALRKLRQHALLRELWGDYSRGELTDMLAAGRPPNSAPLGLARSRAKRETLRKMLAIS